MLLAFRGLCSTCLRLTMTLHSVCEPRGILGHHDEREASGQAGGVT